MRYINAEISSYPAYADGRASDHRIRHSVETDPDHSAVRGSFDTLLRLAVPVDWRLGLGLLGDPLGRQSAADGRIRRLVHRGGTSIYRRDRTGAHLHLAT